MKWSQPQKIEMVTILIIRQKNMTEHVPDISKQSFIFQLYPKKNSMYPQIGGGGYMYPQMKKSCVYAAPVLYILSILYILM